MYPRVVKVPKLGSLVPWIPLAPCVTKGKDPLLCARSFFIPPCPSDSCIETAGSQGIQQCACLQRRTTALGPPCKWVRPLRKRLGIGMYNQPHTQCGCEAIAKLDHFLEPVARINVQQGEGNGSRMKGLLR